ncbi:unnamed protein product [Agarophyton chilense]|eukprot:gb/GEZJ01002112.1/.p1 GENE.gb/GEZJ01002112.1/~~gb/GEZJ01002112.1/.p1  ORF type:complete len:334 (-),score=57.71 gb/GEZJ01002112.1/:380-1381(-)
MHAKEISKHFGTKLRSKPCSALWYVSLVGAIAVVPLIILLRPKQVENELVSKAEKFPKSIVLPHLHIANLSHYSFHEGRVKDELMELLSGSKTDSVVVVGVSYGEEVLRFARAGRRVFAFEPMPSAVENLRKAVTSSRPPLDVHIFDMAATDETDDSDSFNVTYKGKSTVVRTDRVDNHVPKSIDVAVMSVDIQGEEFHAIKGSSSLLRRIRSLWVELKACGEHNVELLKYLDDHYVLFDFVPWGSADQSDDVKDRESFASDSLRPGGIEEYSKWLCEMKKGYKWLQTDVLAVKREILLGEGGDDLLRKISNVHLRGCLNGKCILRELENMKD